MPAFLNVFLMSFKAKVGEKKECKGGLPLHSEAIKKADDYRVFRVLDLLLVDVFLATFFLLDEPELLVTIPSSLIMLSQLLTEL